MTRNGGKPEVSFALQLLLNLPIAQRAVDQAQVDEVHYDNWTLVYHARANQLFGVAGANNQLVHIASPAAASAQGQFVRLGPKEFEANAEPRPLQGRHVGFSLQMRWHVGCPNVEGRLHSRWVAGKNMLAHMATETHSCA